MASKPSKGTSTTKTSSSGCDGENGGGGEKRSEWTQNCVRLLAQIKPAYLTVNHPMNNDQLLDKIINYTDQNFDTLETLRQVHRLSQNVTLTSWRKTATLVIIPDVYDKYVADSSIKLISYFNEPRQKGGVTMSVFMRYLDNPCDPFDLKSKPFQRVKFKEMHMEQEMILATLSESGFRKLSMLPLLLEAIGIHIKYLHFELCRFENTMKFGAFNELITKKIPHVETLVITNCIFTEGIANINPHTVNMYTSNMNLTKLKVCGDFPMPLNCLLLFIPNIKELKVRQGRPEISQNGHYFSQIIIPFANMRKYKSDFYNLTKLDVMDTPTFHIGFSPMNYLEMANLPLKFLSVEIPPFIDFDPQGPNNVGSEDASRLRSSEDLIAPMLKQHQNTLQVFRVFRPPFSGTLPRFPFGSNCEHMEELKIWGNVIEDLNFLKKMPKLKVFYLNTVCYEKWDQMKEKLELQFPYEYQPYQGDIVYSTGIFQRKFEVNLENMTELTIELNLGWKSIEKLAGWMPNLKTFRSIFYKKNFEMTCQLMQGLEELGILYGSEINDEIMTGFYSNGEVFPINVKNLKKLKILRMDAYCGKSRLTDKSVNLGFRRMSTLEFIQICVSSEMSVKAEEDLKRYVKGPVIFIRNYGPGPHENYDCCRRSQFLREVMSRIPRPTAVEVGYPAGVAANIHGYPNGNNVISKSACNGCGIIIGCPSRGSRANIRESTKNCGGQNPEILSRSHGKVSEPPRGTRRGILSRASRARTNLLGNSFGGVNYSGSSRGGESRLFYRY